MTGGFVIVDNPQLRASYSQPLKKKYEDVTDLPKLEDGTTVDGNVYRAAKFEFGAQLKVDFKFNVNDNFAFSSQVLPILQRKGLVTIKAPATSNSM